MDSQILPAPELLKHSPSKSKWEAEHEAFLRLLPELLATNRNQYAAIHDGAVVAFGDTQIDAAMKAYELVGYVPLHVGLISNAAPPTIRMPSPRRLA